MLVWRRFWGGEITAGDALLETSIPNLYVLPAGQTASSPPELFAAPPWKELLAAYAAHFSLILVDSPPVLPLPDFELISAACDGCLAVVRALRTNRDLLQTATRHIDASKLLGVVFNAAESVDGYGSYRRYATGSKLR